jgi:hypothetical protein
MRRSPSSRSPHTLRDFRAHGDTATTYTEDGRIVAIDLQTREVLVNLRTT